MNKVTTLDTKICRVCGESKPLTDFYAEKSSPDGHRNDCKTCRSNQVSRWHTDTNYASLRQSKAKNHDRESARKAVARAIRTGRLVRQGCLVCGQPAQAHHEHYERPLSVTWFCSRHHGEFHAGWRELEKRQQAAFEAFLAESGTT